MYFRELSEYFSTIEHTQSRLEMTYILSDLFKKISPDEISCVLYLLQGRIAPLFVKSDFGMGEKMVIKALVKALHIEQNVFIRQYKKSGDIGLTVESIRHGMHTIEEDDISVKAVFDQLKKIASEGGEGSQERKMSILSHLIRTLDPLSCRYVVRIPIATLRLGFSDMTILDALSWMLAGDKSLRKHIEKAYHVRPDLGYIGSILKKKGIMGIRHVAPALFTPILMMRAERLSNAQDIIEHIGKCAVEPKYDGFRLQIHCQKLKVNPAMAGEKLKIAKNKVRLYSRNLEDVTRMYPDLVEGIIKEAKIDEIICEGEAIGFNPSTGDFLPFQETVQRKRKYDITEKAKEIPLKLFLFDALLIDGKTLLDTPFSKRRSLLSDSFIKGKIDASTVFVADEKIIDDPKKLELLFEESVSKGLEGVIAKKLDGVYRAGAREWNWIKYKKSYSSKLTDTIDCLVMGYDVGRGKRTDFGIGAFLVGIYDPKKDVFVTVSKIGTGLTDEEWKTLKVKSQKLKVKSQPKNYDVDRNIKCDVWLDPSIVLEVRADEITKSPVHTAGRVMKPTKTGKGEEVDTPGFALRFPRLERFRDDRRPEDATTVKEIEKMYKEQKVSS